MKKRNSLIISFLGLLLVNFVSAYYGSYSSFSIRNFLYRIDPVTMTLAIAFFVVFALAYFALTRVIKNKYKEPNVMVSGVLAFCIALFTAYWINLNGLDLTRIFYSIGFSTNMLGIILPFVILIIAIILIAKFGFSGFLITFGLLLIGITTFFEDLIYEKGIALTIGIIMFIFGLYLRRRGGGGSFGRGVAAVGSGGWKAAKWAGRGSWKRTKQVSRWGGSKFATSKKGERLASKRFFPQTGKKMMGNLQEEEIRRTIKKTEKDLRIQYNKFKNEAYKIQRKAGRIPPEGADLNRLNNAINQMKIIEDFARKNGYNL